MKQVNCSSRQREKQLLIEEVDRYAPVQCVVEIAKGVTDFFMHKKYRGIKQVNLIFQPMRDFRSSQNDVIASLSSVICRLSGIFLCVLFQTQQFSQDHNKTYLGSWTKYLSRVYYLESTYLSTYGCLDTYLLQSQQRKTISHHAQPRRQRVRCITHLSLEDKVDVYEQDNQRRVPTIRHR